MVIDEVVARPSFPHEAPIGKSMRLATFNIQAEIVGVVGHVKQWGLDGDAKSTIEAQFYFPFMQLPDQIMRLAATGGSVVLRTKANSAAAPCPVPHPVEEIDSREDI